MIPINIQFGEHTYLSGVELDTAGFYRLVEESGRIPKTSQPTPYQFKEFYEKIARAGETILSMHVTSKLSGTFESAISAARELKGKFNIIPFDSASGSAALGMMCREARLMERAGAGIQQIIERMEKIRKQVNIILTLDKLDYARMSGRVGMLQAALASVLNVKPIAMLHDGILEMVERVRTRQRSLERIVELLSDRFGRQRVNMAVLHARDPQAGHLLEKMARSCFQIKELFTMDLTISLVSNLGPGTVGLVAYPSGGE